MVKAWLSIHLLFCPFAYSILHPFTSCYLICPLPQSPSIYLLWCLFLQASSDVGHGRREFPFISSFSSVSCLQSTFSVVWIQLLLYLNPVAPILDPLSFFSVLVMGGETERMRKKELLKICKIGVHGVMVRGQHTLKWEYRSVGILRGRKRWDIERNARIPCVDSEREGGGSSWFTHCLGTWGHCLHRNCVRKYESFVWQTGGRHSQFECCWPC